MIAQVQLPVSAVLPAALDFTRAPRPQRVTVREEDTESMLHLLAMELVRHSPLTAEKLARAARRKMGGL